MDIDRSGDVWLYRPESHKTENHGHDRVILLGPQAQAVVQAWLGEDPFAFLFSPVAAVANRNAERRRGRKTPMTPSEAKRKPKPHPKRAARSRYDKNAYGQAIARACKKAGVPHWHPNQLRHNAATRVRQRYGIEAARQVLGHRSAAVTELYAEADLKKVVEIMRAIG
jgi:integrase